MIMKAFSVRDKAVEAFLPVFFVRSRGEAIRSFSSAVLDSNHQFSKHRGDFELFEVGEFDDVSGRLSCDEVLRVLSGLEVASD